MSARQSLAAFTFLGFLAVLAVLAVAGPFAGRATAGCPPPCVAVTAVATPSTVCSGAVFHVVGQAVNCGTAPATVVLTLDGGLAQNLGSLAPGAAAPFVFVVTMGPCGPGPATYQVAASATDNCGTVVTDFQTVTLACGNPPCVQVEAFGPASACTGAQIPITGTVHNCASASETITLTLDGGAQQNLGVLAPGASANFAFAATMSCPTGGARTFEVTATAQETCGGTIATDTQAVPVQCGATTCVSVVANGPSSACPGAVIAIAGVATNCGPNDETMSVSANGVTTNLGIVAAGLDAPFVIATTMPSCAAGGSATLTVVATGDSGCNQATDAQTVNVACGVVPCVSMSPPIVPRTACPTRPIRLRGTAVNCGGDAATIVVSIVGGPSATFAAVPAGGSVTYTFALPMRACLRGESVAYTVYATATNACGSTDALRLALVSCAPCGHIGPGADFRIEPEGADAFEPDSQAPVGLGADVVAGGLVEDDPDGMADGAALRLYRPTPNPFTAAMTYAFRVPAGGVAPVEIGVYDVAGRLVRKLATGVWAAGDHIVRWDGADERGMRATPGVYFVRTRVAGAARVDRATFLRP